MTIEKATITHILTNKQHNIESVQIYESKQVNAIQKIFGLRSRARIAQWVEHRALGLEGPGFES